MSIKNYSTVYLSKTYSTVNFDGVYGCKHCESLQL